MKRVVILDDCDVCKETRNEEVDATTIVVVRDKDSGTLRELALCDEHGKGEIRNLLDLVSVYSNPYRTPDTKQKPHKQIKAPARRVVPDDPDVADSPVVNTLQPEPLRFSPGKFVCPVLSCEKHRTNRRYHGMSRRGMSTHITRMHGGSK